MKTLRLIAVGVAIVLAFAGLATAEETPWCDMANCAMCKPFSTHPDLMSAMSMEYHDISDGALQVTSVMPAQMEAYKTALTEMEATGKKVQAGEQLYLCGMCQAFGTLMMSGAKVEMVPTKFGHVQMMRSSSPETVAQIHAWAERTRTEMANMAGAEKAKSQE